MSSAAMPTIGHSPLIALGILGAAAYLEAVLVLHFRGSERALLATVQRENAENRQRSPLHRSHPDLPPVTAYGPKIARGHFPSHRDRRKRPLAPKAAVHRSAIVSLSRSSGSSSFPAAVGKTSPTKWVAPAARPIAACGSGKNSVSGIASTPICSVCCDG